MKARVEGRVGIGILEKISQGVRLGGSIVRGQARELRQEGASTWLELALCEGRNHVVRRLMQKLGHPVIKLRRTSYGPFKLGNLRPGQLRQLGDPEYLKARQLILSPAAAGGAERRPAARRESKGRMPRTGARGRGGR